MNSLERLEQLSRSLDESEAPAAVIEAVTEKAPVLMCTFEHEPGAPLRFGWVSESWTRLLGYRVSELQGRALKEITLPADHANIAAIALLRHGVVRLRVRVAGASSRYVTLSVTWARCESDTTVFATILCEE